jgi:hypothetical protein
MPAPYEDDERKPRAVGLGEIVALILMTIIAFLKISTWLLYKDIYNDRSVCRC